MERTDLYVNISPEEAADKVYSKIVQSVSGELIDEYRRSMPDGKKMIMLVFEKYYMRSSNRAMLTFLADNFDGKTKVHLSAGGGGNGMIFRFDWGAGGSFMGLAKKALEEYICD